MKLVTLIRRRALAYELLAEYDAEHLPVDPDRHARGLAAIRAYSPDSVGVATTPSGVARWRAAIEEPHGRSRRDGTRP